MSACNLDSGYDLDDFTVEFDKANWKFIIRDKTNPEIVECEYILGDGDTIGITVDSGEFIFTEDAIGTAIDPSPEIPDMTDTAADLIFGKKFLPDGSELYSVIGTDDFRYDYRKTYWFILEGYQVNLERVGDKLTFTSERETPATADDRHPKYIYLEIDKDWLD